MFAKIVFLCLAVVVLGRPQQVDDQDTHRPRNYNFEWNVDAPDYENYYGQQEAAVDSRVDGQYYVWHPDGRLMVVSYYVDGDSGFVPTIEFVDDYQPNWGTPYYNQRRK